MKKLVLLFVAFLGVLVLQTRSAVAYGNQSTGSLDDCDITISNTIYSNQKGGKAVTQTNKIQAGTGVNATFKFVDYENQTYGSCYKYNGAPGSCDVYADLLTQTGQLYYEVVSSHTVSYNGRHYSCPELITTLSH